MLTGLLHNVNPETRREVIEIKFKVWILLSSPKCNTPWRRCLTSGIELYWNVCILIPDINATSLTLHNLIELCLQDSRDVEVDYLNMIPVQFGASHWQAMNTASLGWFLVSDNLPSSSYAKHIWEDYLKGNMLTCQFFLIWWSWIREAKLFTRFNITLSKHSQQWFVKIWVIDIASIEGAIWVTAVILN